MFRPGAYPEGNPIGGRRVQGGGRRSARPDGGFHGALRLNAPVRPQGPQVMVNGEVRGLGVAFKDPARVFGPQVIRGAPQAGRRDPGEAHEDLVRGGRRPAEPLGALEWKGTGPAVPAPPG